MKHFSFKSLAAAALLVIGLEPAAFAQGKPNPAQNIAINRTSDLAFGTLIAGPAGGSVTVTPEGARTGQGVYPIPGAFGAARFRVEVEAGRRFTILLPSTATLDRTGGGASMTLDSFVSTPSGTGRVDMPARSTDLFVGATLHVAPGQAEGEYRGSYFVTVTLFD